MSKTNKVSVQETVVKVTDVKETKNKSLSDIQKDYNDGRKHWKEGVLGSTSAMIRYLSYKGHLTARISDIMGKRYQHVRNVLTQTVGDNVQGKNGLPSSK